MTTKDKRQAGGLFKRLQKLVSVWERWIETQESLTQEIKCESDCETPVGNFQEMACKGRAGRSGGAVSPDNNETSIVQKRDRKCTESLQEMGVPEPNQYKEKKQHLGQAGWLSG